MGIDPDPPLTHVQHDQLPVRGARDIDLHTVDTKVQGGTEGVGRVGGRRGGRGTTVGAHQRGAGLCTRAPREEERAVSGSYRRGTGLCTCARNGKEFTHFLAGLGLRMRGTTSWYHVVLSPRVPQRAGKDGSKRPQCGYAFRMRRPLRSRTPTLSQNAWVGAALMCASSGAIPGCGPCRYITATNRSVAAQPARSHFATALEAAAAGIRAGCHCGIDWRSAEA